MRDWRGVEWGTLLFAAVVVRAPPALCPHHLSPHHLSLTTWPLTTPATLPRCDVALVSIVALLVSSLVPCYQAPHSSAIKTVGPETKLGLVDTDAPLFFFFFLFKYVLKDVNHFNFVAHRRCTASGPSCRT